MLCFDDADEELWVEDPEEYIRKGYDIIEDIYSPKTAAVSVLYTLCSSKKKNQLDSIMAFLGSILQEFQSQGQHPSKQTARKMDGALLAIGSLSENLRVRFHSFVPLMHQLLISNGVCAKFFHSRNPNSTKHDSKLLIYVCHRKIQNMRAKYLSCSKRTY